MLSSAEETRCAEETKGTQGRSGVGLLISPNPPPVCGTSQGFASVGRDSRGGALLVFYFLPTPARRPHDPQRATLTGWASFSDGTPTTRTLCLLRSVAISSTSPRCAIQTNNAALLALSL